MVDSHIFSNTDIEKASHNHGSKLADSFVDGLPGTTRTTSNASMKPYVHERMNIRLLISLTAMSCLWIGSQIPIYFYGSVLPRIYSDIGGADDTFIWLIVGYLIPNAALCPFVGALSDLFGRKYVAIFGQLTLIIGPIVVSTSQNINVAIVGMVIAGVGAGLNEMISLAGTSELVPVAKRPLYIVGVVSTILPFSPATLWANLLISDFPAPGQWRWVALFVATFNFIGLLFVTFGYNDPPYPRPHWRDTLRQVDYVGGLLSVGGLITFLVGTNYGAQQYSWSSALVLAPLVIGIFLICSFVVWEMYFAKYPMVPRSMFAIDKRSMIAILVISFFSGGNFFSVILFWPPESYNVYGENLIQNGLEGLPIGMGLVGGSVISFLLIGLFKNHTRIMIIVWCLLMTAFTGAMSAATRTNLEPTVYAIITLACLATGGVILPVSIFAQAIAPLENIGAVTAITLALRYIGGAVAFSAYYNVLYSKADALFYNVGVSLAVAGVSFDYDTLVALVTLAAKAQYEQLHELINNSDKVLKKDSYDLIISGVQQAYVQAYRWPWWISIAFGGISLVAACCMRNVKMA